MSHRYHLPPSAHTTFLASRFVVCTFVPRPIESDPQALKVPFFHNNDDYDEAIFYHRGEFFSRDNIHPGMITLHPRSEEHTSELQSLMRISYAVFCLKKKKQHKNKIDKKPTPRKRQKSTRIDP